MTRTLRWIFFVGWLACTAGTPVYAQTMSETTPEESVRRALATHGMLRSAEFEAEEAQATVRQIQSSRWPAISSQAGYTRLSGNIPAISGELPGIDSTFTIAPVERNRYHTEISIEQPLFTGFRRRSQIQAAERWAEAAQSDVKQQRANVAFEARQAYWTLAEALSRREALETSLEQVEVHLHNVQNQRAAGAALNRDVLAAQTRRSEVRLERVQAENAVRAARLELTRLIGQPGDTLITPQTDADVEPVTESLDELTADVLGTHPEVNALRQQVNALEAEIRAARRQWLPEAALTGRYVYARPNQYFFAEQDVFHGSWEAGLVLRWNLWDGGRRNAETDQATARRNAAEARLEHLEEQITTQVARYHLDVEGAREAVEVARQVVREAEETFRVTQQQFEAGAALSADVLDAEAALRAAQTREAEAVAQHAIARAALLHAAGRVW